VTRTGWSHWLLGKGLRLLVIGLLAIPFLLPLLWMTATALRPAADLFAAPFRLLPSRLTWDNFSQAWGLLDFRRFIGNTLFVAGMTALASSLSSSIVGYAFALLPARGKDLLFLLMMGTIIVPPTVLLMPQFVLFSRLGWTDSFLPLIVPAFFANAFYVFLFRQFFRTLPSELFESAEIDGCNPLRAYWQIALPLSRPALAAVALFAFIGAWNDFLGPLVYLNSLDRFTLSLGLAMFQGQYPADIQYLMPMSLVAVLPVAAIFLLLQHYFEADLLSA
jgi:ABC-type glycerol-3-phosphate transport system permease component